MTVFSRTVFPLVGGIAVTTFLLGSCAPAITPAKTSNADGPDEEPQVVAKDKALSAEQPTPRFLIEGDLYAVPMAVDFEGCEQYTTWSASGTPPLTQPIYFLNGQGSFSQGKTDGSCRATMVKTGADETGCPTFAAEQPDGSSSEVTYYPAASGYTVKRERASCD